MADALHHFPTGGSVRSARGRSDSSLISAVTVRLPHIKDSQNSEASLETVGTPFSQEGGIV
jgi:hypothetical protein